MYAQHWAEEFLRQTVHSMGWLLLSACDKLLQDRDELGKKLTGLQAELRGNETTKSGNCKFEVSNHFSI